ncbi:MAG: Gfo/Idh/MocA family oxidoreductase [Oligoflexia bacterium]|nr:Gfo/Idh/MocA family oxidoreductase [Oligoflexia bacterium]
MNTPEINVAIIGCGRIAGHHCRSVVDAPNTKIRAVCDLVAEKAQVYSQEFGVPYYTNYREMLLSHPEVNLVVIATPSGMHFEHALEVLTQFKRHVVVEKPTFMRLEQLDQIFDTAAALELKIFPVFQNRYNKAVQRVVRALRDGELGKIRIMAVRVRWCRPDRYYNLAPWRGTFAQDGGALTNQGVHHVDLLRFLGGEVGRVSCSMRTLGAAIEVEDSAVAQLEYPNGAIGLLEVTTAARPQDFEASLSLVCENGLAQLGGIAVNELQIFTPAPEQCALHSEDFSGCVYGFGHGQTYRDIAADLRGHASYPVSRADCRNTIQLLHAFYSSAETGAWVDVAKCRDSRRLGQPDEALADLYRLDVVGQNKVVHGG